MNKNLNIAIISKEWLSAYGLKHIIMEIIPSSVFSFFPDYNTFSHVKQKFDHSFSFINSPIPNTIIINPSETETEIRILLRKTIQIENDTIITTSSIRPLLTQRETEILRLLTQGLLNKEVADKLGISLHTVISHRKNIISKLGIKTVSGLTIYALMHNII